MTTTTDATTTVGCRLTWRKRDALHTLALANNSSITDLLRKLVDGALTETGVDLTAPTPAPPAEEPTQLVTMSADLAALRQEVSQLTALVGRLVATPPAPQPAPAFTLNVPGLAPIGALAERQMAALDQQQQLRNKELLEAELLRDRGLTVGRGPDGLAWVWRKGLGNSDIRDKWLKELERDCGCDPRPYLEITPEARDLPPLATGALLVSAC